MNKSQERKALLLDIINLYKTDVNAWREKLYENMPLLMKHSPLMKMSLRSMNEDDILSLTFMDLDKKLMSDADDNLKLSHIFYCCRKTRNATATILANDMNYWLEWYTLVDEPVCTQNYNLDVLHNSWFISDDEYEILNLVKEWYAISHAGNIMGLTRDRTYTLFNKAKRKLKWFMTNFN